MHKDTEDGLDLLDFNEQDILAAALRWHLDSHAAFMWAEDPVDHRVAEMIYEDRESEMDKSMSSSSSFVSPAASLSVPSPVQAAEHEGTGQSRKESERLAAQVNTLEDLQNAIAGFDGLAIKKTATNMVFADGNPRADIMIVGEAPGADEDRQGKPFAGQSGQLLDKILSFINLSRAEEDPRKSFYLSNILNWRPPGNRTPTSAEIEISLPFIEKHICLIRPKILVLCGGVAAKALMNTSASMSKIRGKWTDFTPQSAISGQEAQDLPAIKILPTYHPSYLLHNPAQKKAIWQDMMMLEAEYRRVQG